MRYKKQKIKIVYEEIELIEYVIDNAEYDEFKTKSRFIVRKNKYSN